MRVNVGDRVQIESLDWYKENKDKDGNIVFSSDEMIEGLVEEDNNMSNIDKLKRISTPAEEDWFKIAEEWEKEDKNG